MALADSGFQLFEHRMNSSIFASVDRCRDEILAAAASLTVRSADGTFNADDVVRALTAQGSSYQESTIRTYVSSVMCADAPAHHQNHTDDLRRVDRGR